MEKQEEKGAESVRRIMNNTVQYFDSLRSTTPRHDVNLSDMAEHIRGNEQLKTLTEAYRNATSDEQRKSIKQTTGAFLAAAKVEGARRVKCVTAMTGISLCDIDHIPPERLPEMALRAQADAHTLLSYVTLSGRGLRILFRYELDAAQPLESQKSFYKSAYRCGNSYYARLLGATCDDSCSDAVRLSALCHDDAVYYNPKSTSFTVGEIKESLSEQRKAQTKTATVRRVFNLVCKPRLASAGVEFERGSHNNYVMRVGYMMNDFGLPLADVTAWAEKEFGADYPPATEVIASCYAAQPDEFGKGAKVVAALTDGSARKGRPKEAESKSGKFVGVSEIEAYLNETIDIRTDVISERPEYKMKGEEDEKFRYITDFDAKSLWRKMSRAYEPDKVKLSDVQNVIQSDYAAPYNPLVSYLENLPEWTEEQPDYLAELARTVTVKGGDREQKLFEEYLKKWMVAMVAAWVEPDVVNHTVLVLIGGQGVNKTTWFNFLLPPRLKRYFTLLLNTKNLSDKDEKLKLSFKALVSIEEIEKMDDSLSTYIKAVITAPDTDIRVSYGRFSEQRPHIASFCGTGNNVQFLNEAVSRRWLPFEVTSIVSPRQHPFNHDGIFAQTYHLFRTGFRYWFDLDEINVLARHNRDYQVPCMEEELIPLHFRKPGPEEVGQFFPTTAILKHIGDNISYKLSLVKVGMAMKNLGFERRRNKATKGWICIPINPQDFVDQRKRMAMHSVDDDEQNATLENEGGIA